MQFILLGGKSLLGFSKNVIHNFKIILVFFLCFGSVNTVLELSDL